MIDLRVSPLDSKWNLQSCSHFLNAGSPIGPPSLKFSDMKIIWKIFLMDVLFCQKAILLKDHIYQPTSSEPSPQSFSPSQIKSRLIHFPFEQWNVSWGHALILHINGIRASQVKSSHSCRTSSLNVPCNEINECHTGRSLKFFLFWSTNHLF